MTNKKPRIVVAFRPTKSQIAVMPGIKLPAKNRSDFYRKIFEVGLTVLSANNAAAQSQ